MKGIKDLSLNPGKNVTRSERSRNLTQKDLKFKKKIKNRGLKIYKICNCKNL